MDLDLNGPNGNAFALLGFARTWGKQLEFSADRIDTILNQMISGDYENLVSILEDEFGHIINFHREDQW